MAKEYSVHQITFYPLGNADSALIKSANNRLLLFDFGAMRGDQPDDKRCDVAREVSTLLRSQQRTDLDMVAFTHLDDDHVHGAADFFSFDYAAAYQGTGRVKIR